MKNLKKVLSLVMAVAMMVSICVVGASAVNYDDFSDKGEITKAQAVETLVSLDILNGYNGGETFAPTQPVTRAEMATIICRVLAGGESLIPDATKEVPTYTDIKGNWAESYIEYCTSLGIVSGKGATFEPNANVTAAEAAKMVMTMLGYNADIEGFKGLGWDINSMAKANTLKLTANLVTEISAGKALTREQVAQLVYNALTTPVVQNYVGIEANTWIASGKDAYQETLLETKFNAKKLTGVVIANEHADLYGAKGIKKGTTELALMDGDGDLTGDTKVLNVSTTLDEIGESVVVYWNESTKKVVYGDFQDTGLNVVTEYTAATKNITKGENAVDLASNVEFFQNYGIGSKTSSEYRLSYVIAADNLVSLTGTMTYADIVEANNGEFTNEDGTIVYSKQIRKNVALTDLDMAIIEMIFDDADHNEETIILGEVYVGTQSDEDVSDEMSYRQFCEKYLNTEVDDDEILANENGNYIKAVDFNNDGEVDYVLKTDFVMTTITDISKKGEYTFEDGVKTFDVTSSADLAENDVILYTYIDGVYYVEAPEMVTVSIAKKGINYKTETVTTTDGDEYEQSGIDKAAAGYETELTDAKTEVAYDMYLDHFGYVRLYEESAWNKGIVLLLDGYYETDRRTDLFKAEIFDNEAEERADVTVLDTLKNPADLFIDDTIDTVGNDREEGTWKRLVKVDDETMYFTSDKNYVTNVAVYTANDADEYTLSKVGANNTVTNKNDTYDVVELGLTETDTVKERTYDAADAKGDKVQTTNDTVYYFVITDGENVKSVVSWTGYKNAPKGTDLADAVAYAVTVDGKGAYDVAEVVVFESDVATFESLYFVYAMNGKTEANTDEVFTIGYNAEAEAYETDMLVGITDTVHFVDLVDFYLISDKGGVDRVGDDQYTENNIYAGDARVDFDVNSRDYEIVDTEKYGSFEFIPAETPCYVVTENDKTENIRTKYSVKEQEDDFNAGDKIIVVADKKGNVEYIINVTESDFGMDAVVSSVENLYSDILADNLADKVPTYSLTVVNHIVPGITYTLTDANGNNVDGKKVPAGSYKLTVTEDPAYNAGTYYVTNDKAIVDENGTTNTYTIVVDGDTIVEIVGADAILNTYTITYEVDANMGEAKAETKFTKADLNVTLTAPTAKTGYEFVKWYVKGDASKAKVEKITEIGNVTLVAEFKEVDAKLTVKFYSVDGKLQNTWNTEDQVGSKFVIELTKASEYSINGGEWKSVTAPADGVPVTLSEETTVLVRELAEVELKVTAGIEGYTYTCEPEYISGRGDTVVVTCTDNATGNACTNGSYTISDIDGADADAIQYPLDANGQVTISLSNITGKVVITGA